jgi:D-aspartate ligase
MNVIVFGGDHHNTLGVIRSLGRCGIMPDVLLHTRNANSKKGLLTSKYINSFKIVPSSEEGVEYLKTICEEGKKKIVICTSDDASSVIDQNRDCLLNYFFIPGCERQGEVTRLMNKKTMGEYASSVGLMVPRDVMVENCVIPTNVTFPCITKPILSIEGSKDDIIVCKRREELESFLSKTNCLKFQLQQFIDKEFEYQLIGCSLDCGNSVIIPGRARILSQPVCTNTGFLKYEHLDGTEPIEQCEKFLKGIQFSGLFSMEFLRGKDGKDYFMEINFRNDGNSISVTEAGVNLPYIWYAHCCNLDWQEKAQFDIKEIHVMPEYTEVGLWYIGDISFSRMIREFRMTNFYMDYSKDDPMPTNGKLGLLACFVKYLIKKPLRMLLKFLKLKR